MDTERFDAIKDRITHEKRARAGIGTYQEKTVHAILKDYYAPDPSMQEIPVAGYIADIFTGEEIIEIQTGNFNKMRDKLNTFLPQYPVTIVYPVPRIKYLSWIDEETGECSKPRKSTVKGSVYRAFYELYKIKSFLPDPNLRLCFPMLEIVEYRLLNGWSRDKKKGSCRYDRIPVSLINEIRFERIEDYLMLIPYDLPEPFSVREFGKAVGERREIARTVIHVLTYLELLERSGKRGNEILYHVVEI